MSYEFVEFVDMLSLEERRYNIIPDVLCTIYVERALFDADLLIGLETLEQALHQLKIDAPRTAFKYNGKRCMNVPKNIPKNIVPYCTQCVMGLPVTILFETIGLVCESGKPMFVYADDDENVFVLKSLVIKKDIGEKLYNVNVTIRCSKDSMVEIKFMFDRF